MNRQNRRLNNRDLVKIVTESKVFVAVHLDSKSRRFGVTGNVLEQSGLPEDVMSKDLLYRLKQSALTMNEELDRFDRAAAIAQQKSKMSGRPFDEVFKEELEKSDATVVEGFKEI